MQGTRGAQAPTYFDWDQSILSAESENKSWIQQTLGEGGDDTPLNLFLETPIHSPKSRYQYKDEFHAIRLNAALRNLQDGIFGDPKASRIWFYDSNGRQIRRYNGVMSAQKAHQSLQRRRFGDPLEPDACVRRLHIPHPTSESIGVLILDARRSELCVLKPFLWNHIRGQKNPASISFNYENGGRTFSMTYHIPTFVFHEVNAQESIPTDDRRKRDNTPWRTSTELSFLSKGDSTQTIDILHESQHSFAVYGHNKSTWKSKYMHDTYFYSMNSDNQDTIDYYIEDASDPEDYAQVWDPSTIGTLEANKVSLEPCEYFLAVLNVRCNQWHGEWMNTFVIVQRRIENYFENHGGSAETVILPISRDSTQKTLERIQKHRAWLKQTLDLLVSLTRALRGIIDSWEDFKKDDLDHFPVNHRIWLSQKQINNEVKKMKDIVKGFMNLQDQCHQFRKDLELDIGVHSGPVIALQYLNVTFMQVITPVVVSAALIQAQVTSASSQLVWFLLLSIGLFVLNWHIEPSLSPLPAGWLAKMRNLFKQPSGNGHFRESFREADAATWDAVEMGEYPPFGSSFRPRGEENEADRMEAQSQL